MRELIVVIPLALVLFALLVWLLLARLHGPEADRSPLEKRAKGLLPVHYHYFPQIRQALSAADEQYLRVNVSPEVAQRVRRERRAVAKQFLVGLREDFTNLERLARIVASLSPVISREQETERLLLGLKFRLLYGWVWMRLSAGDVSLPHLGHLTGLVGQLSARMEQAMAAISALSTQDLSQGLSA